MTNTIIQYTKDELKHFSNQELFSEIMKIKDNHTLHWLSRILKSRHEYFYDELKRRTSFLDKFYQNKYDSLPARLYCIEHNINEQPICQNPNCSNPVGWYPGTKSFRKYCCVKCSSTCEATQLLSKAKLMEHYDVESPLQSPSILAKARRTWINNLGVDHPMKSEKVKKQFETTMVNRHGVKHALQSKDFLQKVVSTNRDNFNCDWYTQTLEYHQRASRLYTNSKYPDMTFGSSWEFIVYDFLTEHNIPFEYQPAISFPYEYKGTHHTYHPDFRVGNKIIEVKGDHFFRINESTGQEEMFNPYREQEWSDERYEWECGKYEAKHQCMLSNNVVIIRGKQVNTLEQVFNIRGLNKNEMDQNR